MRLLLPEPDAEVSLDALYGGPRARRGDRPWVGLCMISSLDGSTVVDGRSGALGNATDTAVLGALRRAADLVIVGAATARLERYGPPHKAGQRIGVVTSTGEVDAHSALFASGSGFLIMPTDGRPSPAGLDVVRAGTGQVDMALALRRLDELMDPPTYVQAEGGPRLNGSLLEADCVDELDLTLSPAIVGGGGPRAIVGVQPRLERFELAHLAVDDESYLYGRWIHRRA